MIMRITASDDWAAGWAVFYQLWYAAWTAFVAVFVAKIFKRAALYANVHGE